MPCPGAFYQPLNTSPTDNFRIMIHNNITLFNRDYNSLNNNLAEVAIGELTVTVPDHSFWRKFAQGWEPDTERIYQLAIKPGSTVLDIGAWIGPTILFALACGAEKIIALEPNPESYCSIEKILDLNPALAKKITLLNQAISDKPGSLKMGLVKGESDTSTFGIQGNTIEIQTITISDLIAEFDLGEIDLIKIDIEGAEALLSKDLEKLSQISGQKIHLSIHVPFFPEASDKYRFAQAFQGFTIYDDRGEQLSQKTLTDRITSVEAHPVWGTKHGNFFELLLVGT